jgi:hypothetical protein
MAESEPTAIERRMRDTRRFVELRLADLQTLFGCGDLAYSRGVPQEGAHWNTESAEPSGRVPGFVFRQKNDPA